MRQMPTLLRGLVSLCLVLLLVSCSGNGTRSVLVKPEVVEVQVRQLVPLDPALLEITPLPPLPAPDLPASSDCPEGCRSNRQLEQALSTALWANSALISQILSIADAQAEALNPPKKDEKP